MADPINDKIQQAAPIVLAWFAKPVPLWALLPAFLLGALMSALAR